MREKDRLDCLGVAEEVFVRAVAEGVSLCEAYRRAYPKSRLQERTVQRRAERLMEQPEVRRRYGELMAAERDVEVDRRIADDREVLAYLTAVMRGVRADVCGGPEGASVGESGMLLGVPVKVSEANKAAELLGKRYGLFSDRLQVHGEGLIQIVDDIPEDGADGEVE